MVTFLLIPLAPTIDVSPLGYLVDPVMGVRTPFLADLIAVIAFQVLVAIYILGRRERRELQRFCEAARSGNTHKSENVMRNELRPYIALAVSTGLSAVGLVVTADYLYIKNDVASISTAVLVVGILILLYWLDILASYLTIDQRKLNPKAHPLSGLSRLRETARDFEWVGWRPRIEPDSTDQYVRHTLIVFFLAFALALFGSLEDFYSLSSEALKNIVECVPGGEGYVYTFIAFGVFESLLIALIAIEFTTTYFVRDHERASDLVEALLIAGVLDVAAFIALKTILGQPGLQLTEDPPRPPIYATTLHMAVLVLIAALVSFISSFGAIHYSQLRVDKALKDHLSHLRMLNRLARLAWHDRKRRYDREVQRQLGEGNRLILESSREGEEAREKIWGNVSGKNRFRKTITQILALEEESPANLESPVKWPPGESNTDDGFDGNSPSTEKEE